MKGMDYKNRREKDKWKGGEVIKILFNKRV